MGHGIDPKSLPKPDADPELTRPALELGEPFDPSSIRYSTKQFSIRHLLQLLADDKLDLEPEFQRRSGIWPPEKKGRLIESMLIQLPISQFILDATDPDRWLVIDGLQRLSVLKEFILDQTLPLKGMEFLHPIEGSRYPDLPAASQRRLLETPVTVLILEWPTPPMVKFLLFQRFNTGGSPLSAQEARHALNPGPAIGFLRELAESDQFRSVTGNGIARKRMGDREAVLRVLAFVLTPFQQYQKDGFDVFLNATMRELNRWDEKSRAALGERFLRACGVAEAVFGDLAFRKIPQDGGRRAPINKQLLEVWGALLTRLENHQQQSLVAGRDRVWLRFTSLLADPSFNEAISFSTGKPANVHLRFRAVELLIREVLRDAD